MSKADKMLLEQGFKKTEIKGSQEIGIQLKYEAGFGDSITFGHSIKALSISFHHVNIDLWLAINEKMKELGWFD